MSCHYHSDVNKAPLVGWAERSPRANSLSRDGGREHGAMHLCLPYGRYLSPGSVKNLSP